MSTLEEAKSRKASEHAKASVESAERRKIPSGYLETRSFILQLTECPQLRAYAGHAYKRAKVGSGSFATERLSDESGVGSKAADFAMKRRANKRHGSYSITHLQHRYEPLRGAVCNRSRTCCFQIFAKNVVA
jgi:hypothetical protein